MESKTYQFNRNVFVVIKVFSYNTADNKLKPIYIFFIRYYIANNARCRQARKITHGLDGQHQDVDRTPRGRVNQNDTGQRQMEKVVKSMVWPTLGLRTVKEQNYIAINTSVFPTDNHVKQNCFTRGLVRLKW